MRQIYEYHPTIGFRFIPNLKARIPHEGGGYFIRTNETGFRCDHGFETAKSIGDRRILLFGDSFTAGEGVSNGHRYGDYLEKLIPDLQVYNFGLPATGTDQHYLIYKEYAQEIEHDLMIIAVFVENIRRVGAHYRYFYNDEGEKLLYAKPYYTLCDGELQLHNVPPQKQPLNPDQLPAQEQQLIFRTERFPQLKKAFNRMRKNEQFNKTFIDSGLKDQALKLVKYQPLKEYERADHPTWMVMEKLIGQWISNHSQATVLMPIPLYHYVAELADPTMYQKRLSQAALSAGGAFYDPLPALTQYSSAQRKEFYFPNDGHLTKKGSQAIAQCMAPTIEKLLAPAS